jgi:hypothetical protein
MIAYRCAVTLIIGTTTIAYLQSDHRHVLPTGGGDDGGGATSHPGIDLPVIMPGLYHSRTNALVSSIVRHWPESNRLYDVSNGATPYLVNGDQRTGIPFVINNVKDQEYVRVWTSNPYDGEVLALDVAFPYSNYCHRAVVGDDEDGDGGCVGGTVDGDGGEEGASSRIEFVHDLERPVYLLLHGLNGGSHEEYM